MHKRNRSTPAGRPNQSGRLSGLRSGRSEVRISLPKGRSEISDFPLGDLLRQGVKYAIAPEANAVR